MEDVFYFEDLQPGDFFESEFQRVSEEDIITFAKEYDPQPFHTGEAPLIKPMFDGLIAAGWHTGAICIRQMSDILLLRCAVYCSPGVGNVCWLAPLRPGDEVRTYIKVKEKKESRKAAARGRIIFDVRLSNSNGQVLMTMEPTVLFARRVNVEAEAGLRFDEA